MPASTRRTILTTTIALCLLLPAAAAAQPETDEASPPPVVVPPLEGLAWYRAVDTTGSEIEQNRDQAEVDAWALLAERADAPLDALEYSVLEAFDPAALPDLGSIVTLRVAGAETGALRDAVVQDIIDQAVAVGTDPPEPADETVAGKDVVVLGLSDALASEDAIVYASGDEAWVLLLPRDRAEQVLEQLP